jgi:hypothetical protein
VLIRFSDGYVSIVSGRSLARPYIGIKRMRRRSENRCAFAARSLLRLYQNARRANARALKQPALKRAGWRSGSPLGFCRRRRFCGRCRVLFAELIDAAAGVHNFLLAGVERMAVGTNFDLQILTDGRTRLEFVATGARDRDLFVIGMDAGFHGKPRIAVAAESKRFLEKQRRHALNPYLLARSYDFNAKNRAAHHMRTLGSSQGLSHCTSRAIQLHIFVHNNCG